MFTILTDYESFLVSSDQLERLNRAKTSGAEDVRLTIACRCGEEHAHRSAVVRLREVAGVIAHRERDTAARVIALRRTG